MECRLSAVKAKEVMKLLLSSYIEKQMIFSNKRVEVPQILIPEGMTPRSLEHKQWLFYVTLLLTRSDSRKWFEAAKKMYQNGETQIFDPLWVARHSSKDEIAQILSPRKDNQLTSGIMHPNQAAYKWYWSSVWLTDYCLEQGELFVDPVYIFQVHKDVDDIVKSQIKGLGAKVTSLLAHFYHELGFINHFPNAFPVDVHVMRISYTTGIIKVKGRIQASSLERALRPFYYRLIKKWQVNVLNFSNAIWLLGSFGCRNCPTKQGDPIGGCPLRKICKGYINTENYRLTGRFHLPEDLLSFEKRQVELFK